MNEEPTPPIAGPSGPAIVLQGLSVRFGGRPILSDLTVRLEGKAIGLLGPNGAGKTTLIHTLLGFHPATAGQAWLLGREIRTQDPDLRMLVGYMPESESFIAGMTAVRFVRLMAEISGLPAEAALERAHQALFWVGLGEARYRKVETFSLGMKQLVKLAQAIVHAPRLVFLDEPTNGLDPPARQRMLRLITEIRDAGHARVVLSSHLLRDVEETCDEVIVLRDGKIATVCNLEEERRANRAFLDVEVRGDAARFAEGLAAIGCTGAIHPNQRLRVVLPGTAEVRDLYRVAAEQGILIRRLDYKRDSLQDIFLKAMESPSGDL